MYRVLYRVGRGSWKCDLRRLPFEAALKLRADYVERGYEAELVSGAFSCTDAEAGFAPVVREFASSAVA